MIESPTWYQPLAAVESLGSQINPGSLGGLAEARRQHHAQFFTPTKVAAYLWGMVSPALSSWSTQNPDRKMAIFDSSVGSGRLFQFADPQRDELIGFDIDGQLISKVKDTLKLAGFSRDIECGSMETFRARGKADLAIINPPFSIHLDSPLVEPYPCTTWGRHHRNSSTVSHLYAVHQACAWASCVVAILPRSAVLELRRCPPSLPMARIFVLPAKAFKDEGAEVTTVAIVFTAHLDGECKETLVRPEDLEHPEPLKIQSFNSDWVPFEILRASQKDQKIITTPVTGDNAVRILRSGRKICLRFACGVTEALVLNALMEQRMDELTSVHRQISSVVYSGQGWQDVENYLAQENVENAWDTFLARIQDAGGEPVADPGIRPYLIRRHRLLQRQRIPFGHTIYDPHAGLSETIQAVTRRTVLVGKRFGAPAVPAGETVLLTRKGEIFRLKYRGAEADFTGEDAHRYFSMKMAKGEWTEIYPPAQKTFPAIAAQHIARAKRFGIDRWLSWGYQFEDLIEVCTKGSNGVISWNMGLGKARFALAMATMGGRFNLIVVQAHLVDEMLLEIDKLGIAPGEWQVISTPSQARALRKINIITYTRLRMPIDRQVHARWTYAKILRGKIHTCVCDEVHVLCNPNSDQAKAVASVKAIQRIGLTGTPIANYARDILPLLWWIGGDGTALQIYGKTHPHMEARNFRDLRMHRRSVDVFADLFMTFEWVTNEFADDLRTGAKREVPKIRNAGMFQQMLAPFFKRRIAAEPAVAKYLTIPVPEYRTIEVDWDESHLAHYLAVSEEFSQWFKRRQADTDRRNNLVALLARIGAVQTAANCPDSPSENSVAYNSETSKHRVLVERVKEQVRDGHRLIIFAQRPASVDRISGMLARAGIHSIRYHGGIPMDRRNSVLYREFVEGDVPVLVATYGSCQTGLNLHVADRVIFYERAWTPKTERQAAARVLRPQQKKAVVIEYLHLKGSIDEYQGQMVANKQACVDLAIDYQGEEEDFSEFLHLDTILGRFVEDLSKRFGCKWHEVRARLKGNTQKSVCVA